MFVLDLTRVWAEPHAGLAHALRGMMFTYKQEDSMRSPISEAHLVDADRNPAGGSTIGRGFTIDWQNGPLVVDGVRREPNGAFVEDIIAAALGRIQFYQDSKFNCRENALAIRHLKEALSWLEHRTRAREDRGVEGTHAV